MKKRRKYLVVTPFFPSPGSWRGAYVLDQVKSIKRNSDYEVMVFLAGKKEDDYEVEGIKVYGFEYYNLPSNVLNGLFNGYNARQFVKRVMALDVDLQEVAVVHCHVAMNAACGLALKKKDHNIKVLLQHHDLDPFNLRSGVLLRNNRFNIRYRAKKAIALYNKVDLHVCISEACRDCLTIFPNPRPNEVYKDCIRSLKLCEGLKPVEPMQTYVLYNGVDCELFKPAKKTDYYGEERVFRIGCIANFNELKDHITLIKAFELLIKTNTNKASLFRLSLLGTGETREMCEEYIREHGLEEYIEWPKEMEHDQLPNYYRSLNLFVLPSYFEGFGCVYTEAAACGVPYMGCTGQGYSEYLVDEEKEKWLIAPGDYKQLAGLMNEYYSQRHQQHYQYPFDINILINNFLQEIKGL